MFYIYLYIHSVHFLGTVTTMYTIHNNILMANIVFATIPSIRYIYIYIYIYINDVIYIRIVYILMTTHIF